MKDQTVTIGDPGYFSFKGAGKWASVSTRTIARWAEDGLPTVQVVPRGRRLVRVQDLDVFLISKRSVHGKELNMLVDETAAELGLRRS